MDPIYATLLASLIAFFQWMYGSMKKERDKYFNQCEKKESEIEKLKDQINNMKIKIIKLKASQKDAFFDNKEKKDKK